MGLGKTVQIIALILSNKQPRKGPRKSRSRGTLIISPASIITQWASEFAEKAPNLRILCLDHPNSPNTHAEALETGAFDCVLVTYEVLRRQIYRARPECGRGMRHKKKYDRPKDPLTSTKWWRVVLDEVQMINGAFNAAEMAFLLPAVHRWGVSGYSTIINIITFPERRCELDAGVI